MEPLPIKLIVDPLSQKSHVFVDGRELLNVCAFTLRGRVGDVTMLDLELVDVQVEVEGEAYVFPDKMAEEPEQ